MGNVIEVQNLVKRYGKNTAVDHLSFTLGEAKIYGFLGPNGAGKSTTMNILTGCLGADEGKVLVDGIDIWKKPEQAKRKIGYLPEIPPLYLDFTVQEYLNFVAEIKQISKKKRKEAILEAANLTGVEDHLDRPIRTLSKGYKQRVGLAQAIMGYPEIIILDEPTVGLDPKQILQIRDLIRILGKKHTVILSSHILSEVNEVCDEVIIINSGRLIAQDTPKRLENANTTQQIVTMKLKGVPSEIEALLSGLTEVVSFQNLYSESGQTEHAVDMTSENLPSETAPASDGEGTPVYSDYEIHAVPDEDIRELLGMTFAEHKIPILEMTEKKLTLEDVFLHLTEEKDV